MGRRGGDKINCCSKKGHIRTANLEGKRCFPSHGESSSVQWQRHGNFKGTFWLGAHSPQASDKRAGRNATTRGWLSGMRVLYEEAGWEPKCPQTDRREVLFPCTTRALHTEGRRASGHQQLRTPMDAALSPSATHGGPSC